jgi:Glycosyltransferase
MNNVLLCITGNVSDNQGLEGIINTFARWEYEIRVLDIELSNCLKINSMLFRELSAFTGTRNGRMVVLSDNRTILFSWYRCFNSWADDFIYFIDDIPSSAPTDDFCKILASFAAIDKDPVQGKIYLNLSIDNYHTIFPFLCANGISRYFDDFSNFDPHCNPAPKEHISKKYMYNELEYVFDYDAQATSNLKTQVIQLDNDIISADYVIDIELSPFMVLYLILDSVEKGIVDWSLNNSVYHYLVLAASEDFKKRFMDQIWRYISIKPPDFYATIYLMSLEVILNPQNPQVLKHMMSALLQDSKYTLYHYSIITNILFYISNCNLQIYSGFYSDQRQELDKLCTCCQASMSLKLHIPRNDGKNIAIHVDQLLAPIHSPTKLMLDYAKALITLLPEAKVKIFVEDNLYSNPAEVIVPYVFASASSQACQTEHYRYLTGTAIEVFYADTEKPRFFRTQQIAAAINDFQPDLILTNSCISLAMELLYEHFPMVYFSMGGSYFACRADVYLVAWADEILRNNEDYKLLDSTLIESINVGIDFPEPKQNKSRGDYELTESQFVMITVGNRLHAEMSLEFINEIVNFLIGNDSAVWLLVGFHPTLEFAADYEGLINSRRIVAIPYEYDLVALYDLCDVFVNPVRYGGGNSVAWAMSRKLPVLQLNIASAGLYFVGRENCIGSKYEAYGRELVRLCQDVIYRREFGDRMYDRIQIFNMDSSTSSLVSFMSLAMTRYQKRLNKKLAGAPSP